MEKVNTTTRICIFELILSSRFHLKLTILIFRTKFAQQGYLLSNRENVFECVHGCYLLYQTFSHGGRQTQQYFNVSSPSNRRDKNNDNWTFLIFFVFTIVFPLELESRLYYLFITITTDTSPVQIGCRPTRK